MNNEKYKNLIRELRMVHKQMASLIDFYGNKAPETYMSQAANALEAMMSERDEWKKQAEICRDQLQKMGIAFGKYVEDHNNLCFKIVDLQIKQDPFFAKGDFEITKKTKEYKSESLDPPEEGEAVIIYGEIEK